MANTNSRRLDPAFKGFYRNYDGETPEEMKTRVDADAARERETRRAIEDRLERLREKAEETF